ncbi:MAG: family transcriptional regulator [Acidimicrobiales bacterium]|nr:family transcriptional regulator [Acidimicrobiales bacterium]
MEGILQCVVGANIRRVRKEQGLSQEAFGQTVGWHRTFVGAVERGERNLTLKTVERISDQLEILPIDLLWDRAALGVRLDVRSEPGTGAAPSPGLRAADAPTAAEPTGSAEGPAGPRRPRPTA